MSEIAERREGAMTVLDGLAMQARLLTESATMNMLQLGHVFIQAKELVRHGEWEGWVRENSGMSERQAQTLMQAWRRFGDKPQFQALEKSKLFKMLSLPEGTEDTFAAENNVNEMTSREVEEAVRRVREEGKQEIEAERKRRVAAEEEAKRLASRPPEIPDDIMNTLREKDEAISTYREERERLAAQSREVLEEKNELQKALSAAQRELQETEEMLKESQAGYDRMQSELLSAQSTLAKGDAERVISEQMTLKDFTAAVRQFMGTVAQMPYMAMQFAAMAQSEKDEYETMLATVSDWCARTKAALATLQGGASVK